MYIATRIITINCGKVMKARKLVTIMLFPFVSKLKLLTLGHDAILLKQLLAANFFYFLFILSVFC